MQRLNIKVKMWQTMLSMFFASIAALMISTAPAYADDGTDNTNSVPAQQTPIVQVLDDPVDTPTTVTPQADDQQAGDQQADDQAAEPESLVVVDEAGAATPVPVSQTKADESAAVTGTDTTKADAGIYSITQNGSYTLTGSGYTAVEISGAEANDVQLTLVDATIDATGTGNSAISIVNGAKAILNIIGNCVLTGDVNQAGIQVDADSEVTIKGTDAPSVLKAVGNGGKDYATEAESEADNHNRGAGIGGTRDDANSGAITIDGNNRNLTVSAIGGGKGASGIGSCHGGSASTITIKDAVLNHVYGGGKDAVLLGTKGSTTKEIEYGKGTIEGGSAIGGGTLGTVGGDILIDNCYGRDIVGGGKSAGIGGGSWAHDTNVVIKNSDLEVKGGTTGAAIGTGRAYGNSNDSGILPEKGILNVIIDSSTIVANGGVYGAGIGLGINGSNYLLGLNTISITNSDVTARGGAGAAGIGAGVRGYNVSVSIDGGSRVIAYAGGNYLGKYTERYNGSTDTVTNEGTIGQSGAAGIGRGAWGSMTNFALMENQAKPTLSINADSTVLAMSGGDNWAIAGFTNTDDVAASVLEMRFSRNYDLAGNEIDTRTVDEMNLEKTVCFLDGEKQTILKVHDADTGKVLYVIDSTELPESYANGYEGDGRLGYYSFAITTPSGTYVVSTSSDVRSLTRLGDVELSEGAEGYLGGASYLDEGGTERKALLSVAKGINAYDRMAFSEVAPVPVIPEPDPVPPTPPEPPVVPDTPVTPITPQVDPTPDPAPTPDPTPAPPAPVVVTPATVTPAPVAGAPAAPVTIVDDGVPLAPAAEAIADAEVPLAPAEEAIADDEAPLASGAEEDCWVHWWIMLGIMVTAAYSSVVMARRRRHSNNLKGMDKDIMDGNVRVDEPAANEAPASKPSVNLGPQPALSASTEA